MKITLDDIARKTGLSKSTISRAINNTGPVSKSTRQQVEDALRETGYVRKQPHAAASFASKMILMISIDLSEPMHVRYLKAFDLFFQSRGLVVCALDCGLDLKNELSYLKFASENNFCGVFLLSLVQDGDAAHYDRIRSCSCPVVMINRQYCPPDFDAVCVDSYQAGYIACEQLCQHGHKNIAILSGPDNFMSVKNKLWGALDAASTHGLTIPPGSITSTKSASYHDGFVFGNRLAVGEFSYSAVFCTNYALARGLADALKSLHISVPEQVSIICTDNSLPPENTPDITTIANNETDIAFAAGEMLLNRIEHPDMPARKIIFPPTRIDGNSVADCRQEN